MMADIFGEVKFTGTPDLCVGWLKTGGNWNKSWVLTGITEEWGGGGWRHHVQEEAQGAESGGDIRAGLTAEPQGGHAHSGSMWKGRGSLGNTCQALSWGCLIISSLSVGRTGLEKQE